MAIPYLTDGVDRIDGVLNDDLHGFRQGHCQRSRRVHKETCRSCRSRGSKVRSTSSSKMPRHPHMHLFLLGKTCSLANGWLEASDGNTGELSSETNHDVLIRAGRGDPGQRELGLCMCPFIYVCLGLKVKYQIGQTIESADEVMIILEAMKTEINVTAGDANVGKVIKGMEKGIREGASVQAGDPLVWVS